MITLDITLSICNIMLHYYFKTEFKLYIYICTHYNVHKENIMKFEWDQKKNIIKHAVKPTISIVGYKAYSIVSVIRGYILYCNM